MRLLPWFIISALILLLGCSSEGTGPRTLVDGNLTPTMITDSVNSFVSDSGVTRYQMIAPKWLMYDNADEPYWLFPEGMNIRQFDNGMEISTTLVCDTARYFSRQKLWRLDGHVRVRKLDGDKFLTHQLFWDQNTHKVYSDSFIHIERADRILEGYGFISNEDFTSYVIRRTMGIVPTDGFTGGRQSSPDSESQPDSITHRK